MHHQEIPAGLFRIPALCTLALLTTARPSEAGGFALTPQNAVHLGNAFSAGAAAEDASTIHFNPAGLVHLEQPEVVGSASYFIFNGDFTNDASITGGLVPTPGDNGGDFGNDTLLPTAYVAYPLSGSLAIGLAVSSPFGLSTEHDADWVGRYHAIESELKVVNINPAIAWRPQEWLSIGAGINWQRADADLSNAIDFGLLGFSNGIPGFAPHGADGTALISGDDTSTGYNIGIMAALSDSTRIGWHFRSKMEHRLEGTARFSDVPQPFQPLFPDQQAVAPLTLPESTSLSLFHEFSPQLALTADWSWWNWSRFEMLSVNFENPATPAVAQPQDWQDASIYSIGLRWRQNNQLTWRLGFALNETPVPSPDRRSARIPDSDRTWYTAGLSWRTSQRGRLDLGYGYLAFDDAATTYDDGAGHLLIGDFSTSAHILSAQFTWGF